MSWTPFLILQAVFWWNLYQRVLCNEFISKLFENCCFWMCLDNSFWIFYPSMDFRGGSKIKLSFINNCISFNSVCSQVFNTDEGILSSELGVYVAEAVMDRNVRGARGRFKMYGDDEVIWTRNYISVVIWYCIFGRMSSLRVHYAAAYVVWNGTLI